MNVFESFASRISNYSWRLFPMLTESMACKVKFLQPQCWGGENFYVLLERSLPCYLSRSEIDNPQLISSLTKDMLRSYRLYGINPEEYLIHHFREKSESSREEYISKMKKDLAIIQQAGSLSGKAFDELKNKYVFYQMTKDFFRRRACCINSVDDWDVFYDFCNRHNKFFAKPIMGRYGRGNRIVDLEKENKSLEELFKEFIGNGTWIIEELIEQDERMGAWNETSVNTIRIPSFRTTNGIRILYPFIRMGRRGAIVDNAGSGGLMAVVDAETGRIATDAKDELGHVYMANPDNGMVFKGWQIPEWESIVSLSKEIHESLPDYHKYVGFDFALSKDNGWVLVEGNWGDFICQQACLERGLKRDFLELLNG